MSREIEVNESTKLTVQAINETTEIVTPLDTDVVAMGRGEETVHTTYKDLKEPIVAEGTASYLGPLIPTSEVPENPTNKPVWGDVGRSDTDQTFTNFLDSEGEPITVLAIDTPGKLSYNGTSWSYVKGAKVNTAGLVLGGGYIGTAKDLDNQKSDKTDIDLLLSIDNPTAIAESTTNGLGNATAAFGMDVYYNGRYRTSGLRVYRVLKVNVKIQADVYVYVGDIVNHTQTKILTLPQCPIGISEYKILIKCENGQEIGVSSNINGAIGAIPNTDPDTFYFKNADMTTLSHAFEVAYELSGFAEVGNVNEVQENLRGNITDIMQTEASQYLTTAGINVSNNTASNKVYFNRWGVDNARIVELFRINMALADWVTIYKLVGTTIKILGQFYFQPGVNEAEVYYTLGSGEYLGVKSNTINSIKLQTTGGRGIKTWTDGTVADQNNFEIVYEFEGLNVLPTTVTDQQVEQVTGQLGAAVIRNSTGTWEYINDTGHAPRQFNGITTNDNPLLQVSIMYPECAKVGSMVIGPDEMFAQIGLFAGGSVGTAQTNISIVKQGFGVLVKWDGMQWVADVGGSVILKNEDFSFDFTSGQLTITHTKATLLNDLNSVSITNQNGGVQSAIKVANADNVRIRFYDMAGANITTPTLNCAVYLVRNGMWCVPNDRLIIPAGNLWVLMQNNL